RRVRRRACPAAQATADPPGRRRRGSGYGARPRDAGLCRAPQEIASGGRHDDRPPRHASRDAERKPGVARSRHRRLCRLVPAGCRGMAPNPGTDMNTSAVPPLRQEVSLGLLLMVLSVLISPIIDIFAKLAVTTVPATEITFVRLLFQMTVLGPICLMRGTLLDVTWKKMGLHAARGLLMAITMISFVTPLAVMEVADAIAI